MNLRVVLCVLLLTSPATAQSVQQSGTVTRGHVAVWNTSGVIADGGSSASSPISSIGVTNNGSCGIGINSALPTSAGWQQLCLGVTTAGVATISLQNFGTAPVGSFQFVVNGAAQGFPTVSPLPVVVGDLACFGATSGGLTDCGTAPSTVPLVVGTTPVTGAVANGLLFNNAGLLGSLPTGTNVASALGNPLNGTGGLVGFSGNIGAASGTSLNLSGALTLASLTGSTQCLQVNSAGVVSATGATCGSGGGGGAVNAVSNSDGTLTITPTTGAVVASINLTHANTWTGVQTFTTPNIGAATGTSLSLSGFANVTGTSGYELSGASVLQSQGNFIVLLDSNLGSTSAFFLGNTAAGVSFWRSPGMQLQNSSGSSTFAVVGASGVNVIPTTASTSPTTGALTVAGGAGIAGALNTGVATITSASASALAVGPNGATNPVLQVNASTSSQVNGVAIIGGTAGSGVQISTISSSANDVLFVNAKGSGGIFLGNISTGPVISVPPFQLGLAGSNLGTLSFSNLTSGSIQLSPPTGALGSAVLTLPDVTDTLTANAATQTLTNKTLTSPVLTTPNLGTPSAATLTNATGLPISTGVSGLGTGVAAQLANAVSTPGGSTTTIAAGTAALGTSAIGSASCATITASAPNVTTTDVVTASFNGSPIAVTGYIPATSGMLTIIVFPTAGDVNFDVCNNTSASITPGAITLNWKVVR